MEKNKDIINIGIITIFLVIGFLLFRNNFYFPLSDIGREFFIPSEMAEGKVLYKDIFNIYPPFGYFINAITVKIFGNFINTFQTIGLILSFCILSAVYKIAKIYTTPLIALLTSIFIIFSCTFYPSISNWLTPYSYSILYALAAVMWAIYFLIKYNDTDKNRYLYYSSVLYGLSLSCKYEYIFFGFIIAIVLFYKKQNIYTFFKTVLFILFFPLISFIILLIQKVSLNDFIQAYNYALLLSKSSSVKFFYWFSGLTLSFNSVLRLIYSFFHPQFVSFFYSIVIWSIIILTFVNKSDLKYLILHISAVLLSYKVLGGISFEIYGTYFFPFLFINLIAFLYCKKVSCKFLTIILIILILSYSSFVFRNKNFTEIETVKGVIKTNPQFKEPVTDMLDFISKMDKSDKILVLPEGVFLNYLTDTKTDNYLFYLIPPNVEIFGTEYVINRIKNGNYKYIAVSNVIYPWYNQTSFTNSWGGNIIKFIQSAYHLKLITGENYRFYIYEIN